jgi:hypothetical protein
MKPRMESNTSSVVVIGIDIGREVFRLVGLAADGKIAFRRRIRRLGLKDAFEKLPSCIVAMEAIPDLPALGRGSTIADASAPVTAMPAHAPKAIFAMGARSPFGAS